MEAALLKTILAEREIDFKKRGPKVPTDAQFGRMVLATQGKIDQLGSRLFRGILNPLEYIEALFDVLERAHTEAVVMGRKIGGDMSPIEADDELFAQLVMDREAIYLQNFQNDLLVGRYIGADGDLKLAQINARARLYAGKLRATANETFVLSSETTDTFIWADIALESCEQCPIIARGGPYTVDQLNAIGYPGQGRQPCRTNCGCVLIRSRDKVFGFSRSYL